MKSKKYKKFIHYEGTPYVSNMGPQTLNNCTTLLLQFCHHLLCNVCEDVHFKINGHRQYYVYK